VTTSTSRAFAITYDYRCPFARIAHDHVIAGLRAGADWDVTFLPFSLGQAHVEEGGVDVWDDPDKDTGLLAEQISVVARDKFGDQFLDLHGALFEYRHADGGNLQDREQLTKLIEGAGIDPTAVWDEVDSGRALATVKEDHQSWVGSHKVWGVPTFIVDEKAVFVRLMNRAEGDGDLAIHTIDRVLDEIDWPILNEFKHTSIPR
jgi:hypothetical protein